MRVESVLKYANLTQHKESTDKSLLRKLSIFSVVR
jgi:hypothetical protein